MRRYYISQRFYITLCVGITFRNVYYIMRFNRRAISRIYERDFTFNFFGLILYQFIFSLCFLFLFSWCYAIIRAPSDTLYALFDPKNVKMGPSIDGHFIMCIIINKNPSDSFSCSMLITHVPFFSFWCIFVCSIFMFLNKRII